MIREKNDPNRPSESPARQFLLIEDNPVDATVLEEMLRRVCHDGVAITHVKTLREGLAETKTKEYDAAILDLGLPDSHGLGTLGILLRSAKELPIVVVTGYDEVEFGIRALRMGARGYLFKSGLEFGAFKRALERATGAIPDGAVGSPLPNTALSQSDASEEHDIVGALPKLYGKIYRAERILGGGVMGTVYYGVDTKLDREVAIKVLRSESSGTPLPKARFDREAKTLAQLDHEAIVPVYSFGQEGKEHYFVMPFVRGTPLSSVMRGEPLTIDWFQPYLKSVCEALDYAHEKGVVHRDLKPANIILSHRGDQAKLLDFGIAMNATKSRLTQHGHIVGTPSYMSPEQAFNANEVGPQSDQYALAVVTYEVLAGHPPFDANKPTAMVFKHLSEKPEALDEVNPEISEELSSAIARGLAKRPSDRYASCGAFFKAISKAVEGPQVTEPTRAVPKLAERLADKMMWEKETIPNLKTLGKQLDLNEYIPEGLLCDIHEGLREEQARRRLAVGCDQLTYSYQVSVRSARRVLDLFLMDPEREVDVLEACQVTWSYEDKAVASTVRALLAEHLAWGLTGGEFMPSMNQFESLAWVSCAAELPIWQQLIMDPDPERRVRALRAVPIFCQCLLDMEEREAQRTLTQALFWAAEDGDEESSLAALAALARVGIVESAELLIQRYRTASGPDIRLQILDALGDLYDDDNLPDAVRMALHEEMQRLSGRPSGVDLTVRAKLARLAAMTEEDLEVCLVPNGSRKG